MKIKKILERFEGSKNSNYKGDTTSGGRTSEVRGERAKHLAQEKKHGKAIKCSKCGSTRFVEWAQLHGGGWAQMCKSCHSAYDKKQNNFHK